MVFKSLTCNVYLFQERDYESESNQPTSRPIILAKHPDNDSSLVGNFACLHLESKKKT